MNNLFIEIVDDKSLKVKALPEDWAKLVRFIRSAFAAYRIPEKALERMVLACEELFGNLAEQAGADEINTKIKPLENGISVSFRYKGGDYDPTKADESSIENLGLKIVKKTTDVFTYSAAAGRSTVTISKYWNLMENRGGI
jgi:anti-sigma regulatory factor (Ser/Thr protein kinase)